MDFSLLLPWVAMLSSLALAGYALARGVHRRRRLDIVFGVTALAFAALAVLDLAAAYGWIGPSTRRPLTQLAYQLMTLGVIVFLLLAARGWRPPQQLIVGAQAVLGLALIVRAPAPLGSMPAWALFNLLCATVLLMSMVYALVSRRAGAPVWMAMVAALASLNVMVGDFQVAKDGVLSASWSQVLLLLILLALWLACTRRVRAFAPPGPAAPALDRQRLAQDLHDGVGSHLTSIISALDAGTAKERSTAALLQECLVELKLLVDGMDEQASVLSLLASLRYRIEPLLSAAHIRLHWAVADDEELERVTGDTARQVLHLTQEALANVLRHSGADQVSITCCVSKAQQSLMLEINDNGVGLPEPADAPAGQRPCGKGLRGMRARAHQLGGQLLIESAPHRGTRLRMLVPLMSLETEES
ncbi:MAG: hypothetical protein J0I00_14325 [Burkholderiales bacterium]|nr:hypothetical protein [Burkholderiales bacterium]